MAQLDRSGFSLFPMPPTPPTKRPRARALLTDQPRLAVNSTTGTGSQHRNSDCPTLRPAPLKLRKKRPFSNQPPAPAAPSIESNAGLAFQSATPSPIPQWEPSSPTAPDPASSAWPLPVPEPRSQEGVGSDTEDQRRLEPVARTPVSSKRASCRTSLFLDGDGQVDRKKLSMYLSGVLDPSFKVAVDSTEQTPLPFDFAERVSYASNEWRESFRPDAFSKGDVVNCQCPPGVVMCQCYSSPEFEHFRRGQGEHKANPSISSTTCFLSVPRARFRSTLVDVTEVDTPSSPPPLMYDSEDSDEFDWSLPNSPTFQRRQLQYQQTPTPAARQPPTKRPPVPSFSLPFSHGKQIRPKFHVDRTSMPWEQPSPSSSIPTLASISTISTFTFDFRDDDDETDYDPFDDGSDVSEIRTWEPIQKAKPVLIHCKGPSPQSIKYGHDFRYRTRTAGSYSSDDTFGYATVSAS
ncbi:hypothetical protein A1O3_01358 [Capronia epimyces CBS 606.96]|uniref:Uncharacterized protein n=1 Tax=Capronia epimyces CBS 606.96 TaxID=1182542 RepID=W9ZE59_9EURO|nr:uncharacterized protein A1O3_01358 [Capronia epimyces CBS 606.96]EXJ92804.1 hypothetical protein A1O3_01358 [Capronia epimyces CBS 606.96]